ncbi:MAG TPA: bifunctional DNA primase/polymerase [Trueperaceae bacterium]|nr:bifunctional DNA primase/polymerase [Trueperaceae bacterium]
MTTTSSIFDVAALGYRVYPWYPSGKSIPDPATNATTNPPQEWGHAAQFSILCTEDVLCVDIDRHDGGADGFEAWQAAYGDLPEVSKPSNSGRGLHGFYRVTPEQRAAIKKHTVGLLPGVDIAWNAKCLATQSYDLPPVHDLPPVPDDLMAAIAAEKRATVAPVAPGETPRAVALAMRNPIPRGEQWTTLLSYAAHMASKGYDPTAARELFAAALARCEHVDDEKHAWTAFDSAYGGRFYAEAVERQEYDAMWGQIIAGVQADEAARRSVPAQALPSAPGEPEEPPAPLYGDVAALLAGDLPEPPVPGLLRCSDGLGLFYEGKYNVVYGDPESGKTWVALAAVVETIKAGNMAVVVDMDHNGMAETVARLLQLGATPAELGKPELFLYTEPEDGFMLDAVVADLVVKQPALVTLDSIGEIVASYGKNSNLDDDFTWVHQRVMKRLVRAGAAVVAIDHLAKGEESRTKGASGAAAKKRVIDGSYIRCIVTQQFSPGKGGRASLVLSKDRNGGLRKARGDGKVGDIGLASFWLRPVDGWVLDAPVATEATEDREDKLASAPVRILAFLKENAGQRFTAEQIAREAVQMKGQQISAALKTARNRLTALHAEGQIQRGHKSNPERTLVYWVDIQE